MNKQIKKIIIILAGVLVLASIILLVVFLVKNNSNKLEKSFKSMAVEYYEVEIEPRLGKTLTQVGHYLVTLEVLEENGYDVSKFKDKSCDPVNSYVTFVYDENDNYDLEVTLKCEK